MHLQRKEEEAKTVLEQALEDVLRLSPEQVRALLDEPVPAEAT